MNAPDWSPDHDAAIAALRGQGAERLDPVRFRFIEALARRAQAHAGEVRRLLDARVEKALQEYGERFAQAQDRDTDRGADAGTDAGTDAATRLRESGDGRTPLAELAAYLAQHSPAEATSRLATGLTQAAAATHAPPAELKSLRYFRDTWAKLSVDQQLAQALAQGPENAGPLNSHLLVLRALERMRDLSPDYLNRFMSYADALLWLDQANNIGTPAEKKPPPGPAPGEGDKKRKSDRGGARKDGGERTAKRRETPAAS